MKYSKGKENINHTPLKIEDGQSVSFDKDSQLDLFNILETKVGEMNDHSNMIDIYDAIPKYVWGKGRELTDLDSASISRTCVIKGRKLTIKLKPALIERGKETILLYPSIREELVEDALRKIAVSGGSVYVNNLAGVRFTLYQLRMELKRLGHTLSLCDIKEALLVCKGSIIECRSEDGNSFLNSNLFGLVGLTTRSEYNNFRSKGGASDNPLCFVQFNPLVNDSILKMTYRQFNYKTLMSIPGRAALSRYIYKRMCQYWTQASDSHPYTPSLVSFLEKSPRGITSSLANDAKAMRRSLDILIAHDVVESYTEEKKSGVNNRLLDIKFTIYPHKKFVSDTVEASKRKRKLLKNARAKTKSDDANPTTEN